MDIETEIQKLQDMAKTHEDRLRSLEATPAAKIDDHPLIKQIEEFMAKWKKTG